MNTLLPLLLRGVLLLELILFCLPEIKCQQLLISKIFSNPSGNDSPFEYVELVATETIDFNTTPHSVVFSNNGAPTPKGWIAGGTNTFGFSLDSGKVYQGEIIYVGGSSIAPTGKKWRLINTANSSGDRFGKAAAGGVLGNGGPNADAVAVFNIAIEKLTENSVPLDAFFYGTGPTPGGSVVENGISGFELPVNDLYKGGKLQANNFLGPDPSSDDLFIFKGNFNTSSKTFVSPRTLIVNNIPGGDPSSIKQNIEFSTGPFLTTSTTNLKFTSTIGIPSSIQSYQMIGTAIEDKVTITAPAFFSISLDSLGKYDSLIEIPATSLNQKVVNVYVKFISKLVGITSAKIIHVTGNVSQNLPVTGIVAAHNRIFTIQGSGTESLLKGNVIETEGVVTGDFQTSNQLKGFYIQDTLGDGNDESSDGIFVFDNLLGVDVKIGDYVRVLGTIAEYNGQTEIKDVTVVEVLGSRSIPASTVLILPALNAGYFERWEGMYVTIPQELTVIENYNLGRYGELTMSSSGLQQNPTNYIDPNDLVANGTSSSGYSNTTAISTQILKDSLARILLDDGSNVQNPNVLPFIDSVHHTMRIGSSMAGLTGILAYNFDQYRIEPLNNHLNFTYAQRPSIPDVGNANLKVASLNVLNFFNGDGKGGGFPTERGATTLEEFRRQKEKIVQAILQLDADILGIMEMENDGDHEESAIAELVKELNLIAGPQTYEYIRDPKGGNGNTGNDAIKVATIYKSSKLLPVGLPVSDTNAVHNRPPLAQIFLSREFGEKFTIIVNHFKSKGCDNAQGNNGDQKDGQGCWNDQRKNQSTALLLFISKMQKLAGDNDIISIGDYNSYEEEDPLDLLKAGGLVNLISNSYSYVFNGYSGSLDHAFVNAGFAAIAGAEKWHINAAEPKLKDYNQEFNPAYVYAPDAYRASDHDPLLIGLKFTSYIPKIIRGPYLQKLSEGSIMIKWTTDTATNSRVTFGSELNIPERIIDSNTLTKNHQVVLTGLHPATLYYYTIGTQAIQLQGDAQNHFKTLPLKGEEGKYTFWVTGDCGNNSGNQKSVLDQYNQYMGNNITNGWILLGDNAYYSGLEEEYTLNFFAMYQSSIMKHAPLFPAPGNHDYGGKMQHDDPEVPYFSIFDVPTNGEAGGIPSHSKAYYSFDYGNIHFLSLDSYGVDQDLARIYDTIGNQAQWVKADLAANKNKWTIAFFHHPPFTMGSHNSDLENELMLLRKNFISLLENAGVDLVLCGHSHVYERSRALRGHYDAEGSFNASLHNTNSSSGTYDGSPNSCPYIKDDFKRLNGTIYVVTGSAGQVGGQQETFPHNAMYYSDAINGGSLILTVEGSRLDAKWLCADGVIRDQFTVLKKSGNPHQIYSSPGEKIVLKPSWIGDYHKDLKVIVNESLEVAPLENSIFILSDKYGCVSDTFIVNVDTLTNIHSSEEFVEVRIYPNPSADQISVDLELKVSSEVRIELISQDGKQILVQQEKWMNKGSHLIKIGKNNYPIVGGVYLVKISINGTFISAKVVFI